MSDHSLPRTVTPSSPQGGGNGSPGGTHRRGRRERSIETADGICLSARVIRPLPRAEQHPSRGIILVHGFAAEKTENGLFPAIALALARAGAHVLLYDWRGLGKSSGTFHDSSLDHHASDFETVRSWFVREESLATVSAVGFSLGAAVIAMASSTGTKLCSAAFLSPAIRLHVDMWPRYSDLASCLNHTPTVSKPGSRVLLGKEILASLRMDLSQHLRRMDIPVFACHGTNDTKISIESTQLLFEGGNRERKEFLGASHSFRPAKPHREDLKKAISQWFAHAHPASTPSSHSTAESIPTCSIRCR